MARVAELSYPLFVKPARGGSSIGITQVNEPSQLVPAIEAARTLDPKVVVEQGFTGVREIECAVLGHPDGRPRVSLPGEIVMHGPSAFYDFEAKYLGAAGVELELPAKVTEAEFAAIRDAAVLAFEAAQLAGLARIDFFLTAEGPVLNEINTLPGFTPVSMYPRLWEESGLSYSDLITELIELALED